MTGEIRDRFIPQGQIDGGHPVLTAMNGFLGKRLSS